MPPAQELPEVGRTIGDGRFELLAKLGEGGMSGVFHARDHQLGRELALKLLLPRYLGRPEREQRLINEAVYLAKLRGHPNIIELCEWGRLSAHAWPWLSTELLAGESLDWLLVRGKLEAARVIDIASQVAGALAACHERGVVHRDTTPGNVFVLEGGGVKLFDFSHAGALGGPRLVAGAPGRLTGAHDTPGTIGYMGPEQAARAPADPTMDVFGFGALLFELITRRNPFAQIVEREAFIQAQREGKLEAPRLHAWAYEMPEELAAIVHDCMLPASAQRPTMAQVCRRLAGMAAPRTDVMVGASSPAVVPATPRSRKHPTLAVLVGVALVVALAVALSGGWLALGRADRGRSSARVQLPEPGTDAGEHALPEPTLPEPTLPESPSQPEPRAEPEPEPRPDPNPQLTSGDPPPKPTLGQPREPSCDGVEAQAHLAFEARQWRTVLTHTARKTCWSTQADARVRLRTTALFNLGRWGECATIGAKSDDPKIRSTAEACQAAVKLEPPESK